MIRHIFRLVVVVVYSIKMNVELFYELAKQTNELHSSTTLANTLGQPSFISLLKIIIISLSRFILQLLSKHYIDRQ